MSTNISQFAATLAGLDFSEENAKIADLQQQVAELQSAIDRGEARCTEISQSLAKGDRPDGRAVADALLAERTAQAAAVAGPSREAMEEERAALREGLRDLRDRMRDVEGEITSVKRLAMHDASEAAQPLIDDLIRQAREAIAVLPALYGALYATNMATHGGRRQFEDFWEILRSIPSQNGISPLPRVIEVPAEIANALKGLADKGPALRDARFIRSVQMP